MNKLFSIAACGATLIGSAPALAGEAASCHFHGNAPAAEKVVVECATQRKKLLVSGGKIDKNWEVVKHNKVEQVEGKKGKEWKVSFKNASVSDPSKATLYIFLSLPGNYLASNFTGQ